MNYFFYKTNCLLAIFLFSLNYEVVFAQNRIIGGSETTIEKYPYMLRLHIPLNSETLLSSCGASIIGKEWALTAAHCFDDPNTIYTNISVLAGTTNKKKLDKTASVHKVILVTKHELYEGLKAKNKIGADIAVMKISPPFTYSKVIQPIKLPKKGQTLKTDSGTVAGWGHTKPGGENSDILRAVSVPKVDTKTCDKSYSFSLVKLKEGEICYGYSKRRDIRDKCQGDSGGPLINSDKVQIGVVSWGIRCGTKGYPGVYTDVLYFRDWIKEKTGI